VTVYSDVELFVLKLVKMLRQFANCSKDHMVWYAAAVLIMQFINCIACEVNAFILVK
jgi:hypothetical protein